MKKNIILIPTYNEFKNISILVSKIIKLRINCDILFIDDNSTDGSKEKIINLSKKNKSVKYIFRKNKLGIGSAHKAGFIWCYKKKYKKIITMDADGTHNPKYIKKMLNLSKDFHLVTTTRFNNISSLKDWPLWRVFLTNLRHKLLKFLLNLEFDASGAFRVIDSKKIKLKDILLSNQNGYSYFWESLYLLKKKKYKISEISIQLPYRKLGSSKMKIKDIIHAFYSLFLVYIKSLVNFYDT